jgi:hypothetical protein
MKKLLIGAGLLLGSFGIAEKAAAQVRVNVNVNIGSQPNWGPSGYDYVDYYYLPDIETYYYVPTRQFIYLSGGNWMFAYHLPPAYRTYNLYTGYKVVVNQPRAYEYHHSHKIKYAKYKGNRGQSGMNRGNGNSGKAKGHGKGKHRY